ncbi:MAG: hypothetical protein WBG58_17890 [Ignavibacteriaceae bacterium]
MKKILLILLFLSSIIIAQSENDTKKWEPIKSLIGKWEDSGTGKFGDSKIEREYEYLMGGTFIIGKNKSTYEEQEKNPEGEIHDHWDIISYDKVKAKYVFRQFHAEDITNTFSLDSLKADQGLLEFESESIENFIDGWKAKEVYNIINENEFIEIFYLAAPGKDYSEYVRNTFKRIE